MNDPRTQNTEARVSQVQDQCGLHNKTISRRETEKPRNRESKPRSSQKLFLSFHSKVNCLRWAFFSLRYPLPTRSHSSSLAGHQILREKSCQAHQEIEQGYPLSLRNASHPSSNRAEDKYKTKQRRHYLWKSPQPQLFITHHKRRHFYLSIYLFICGSVRVMPE